MFALFDQNVAEDGGGSNAKDRIVQFNAAFNLFIESPIWGNGVGSLNELVLIGNNSDIAGAESSWMKLLTERGIIGAIAYVYLYYELFCLLIKSISRKTALFFLGGLLAMETATGFMDFTIYGSICIALLKYRTRYCPRESVNYLAKALLVTNFFRGDFNRRVLKRLPLMKHTIYKKMSKQ